MRKGPQKRPPGGAGVGRERPEINLVNCVKGAPEVGSTSWSAFIQGGLRGRKKGGATMVELNERKRETGLRSARPFLLAQQKVVKDRDNTRAKWRTGGRRSAKKMREISNCRKP